MSTDQIKRRIRKEMIQKRVGLDAAEQRSLNQKIQRHILKYWKEKWGKILIYINQPDEAETIPLIKELLNQNKMICVPAYRPSDQSYFPSELKDFERDLEPGRFGILEPREIHWRPVEIQGLDVLFIPGLAFDRNGNRLGYGYGYFDALCRSCMAEKIGLAYHFQMVDQLEPHRQDVPLDCIITDQEIIQCQKK